MGALVEFAGSNLEGYRIIRRADVTLRGLQVRAEVGDLCDVRRVDADESTGGQSAVQLALNGGNGASSVRARCDEAKRTTRRLDSLVSRRHEPGGSLQHERGTFRVKVGVGVADILKSGPDVAEADRGGIGRIGGEENSGHSSLPFQDNGRDREHARDIAAARGEVACLRCVIHV